MRAAAQDLLIVMWNDHIVSIRTWSVQRGGEKVKCVGCWHPWTAPKTRCAALAWNSFSKAFITEVDVTNAV